MSTYLILFLKLGLPIVVAVALRRWLVALWAFALLVLPLSQVRVVGAPLYIIDLLTGLAAIQVSLLPRQPGLKTPIPWHWILIGLGIFSTLSAAVLLFGFFAEQLWIIGHGSAVYLAFYIVTTIYCSQDADAILSRLKIGIAAALVTCSAIAIIQYFSLPGKDELRDLLYGDLTANSATTDVGESIEATLTNNAVGYIRVPGSHFAPTTFGGITLVAFGALVILEMRRFTLLTIIGAISTFIVTGTTVSRHVVLALSIGVFGFLALGTNKQRTALAGFAGAAAAAALPYIAYISYAWAFRMQRFSSGILEDENITARVIEGPQRLIDFFSAFPEMMILGAGLEPEKLISRAGITESIVSGYASNGYLLVLYQLGIVGLLAYGTFWLRILLISLRSSRETRGVSVAVALICGVIIACDNYPVAYEPAATVLFITAACITGEMLVRAPRLVQAPRPTVSGGPLRAW